MMPTSAGRVGIVLLFAAMVSAPAQAKPPAFLELNVGEEVHQGKLVAMDKHSAWVMTREGRLLELAVNKIKGFKRLAPEFEPLPAAEVRDALRREFGKGFEIAGSEHYLVCAPTGKAREYAQLFEQIYRSFRGYFSVRGFRMADPEFPLVAIVFPDQNSFGEYCKGDGVQASPELMGYYLPSSNRVALFDSSSGRTASPISYLPAKRIYATIEGSLADTIVHETTHQVAFNLGLHSRIGETPTWIAEGLATVFESPGVRNSASSRGKAFERVNRERYVWFRNYVKTRREAKSLGKFVSTDTMFRSSALDAYAEAWALSFYLIETRPTKYAKYLKTIAERDPMKAYPQEERLADFQSAFGDDLDMLEAEFLRFISRLED